MLRFKYLLLVLLITLCSGSVSSSDFLVDGVRLSDSSSIISITANYEARNISIVTNGLAHFDRVNTSIDNPGPVLFRLKVDGVVIGSSDLITWFLINPTNNNVRLKTNGNLDVTVESPPRNPQITLFTVSEENITLGDSVIITWDSTDTDYCEARGDFVPNGILARTKGSVSVTESTLGIRHYQLVCFADENGVLKSDFSSLVANVTEGPNTPTSITSFYASSPAIEAGEPITLSWSSTGMVRCSGQVDFLVGGTNLPTNGSKTFIEDREGVRSYYLRCVDGVGIEYNSSVVNVNVLPGGGGTEPAIRFFSSNKSRPEVNESFTVSWDAINVTNCVASGSWSGTKAISGSATFSFNTTGTRDFNLRCTDSAGTAVSDTLLVTVISTTGGSGVQITSFTATPDPVAVGTDLLLNWSSVNAFNCRGMSPGIAGWIDIHVANGSKSVRIVTPGPYTFVLRCSELNNSSAFVEASIIVETTGVALPPVTTTLSVNKTSIIEGESVTFTWASTNADFCITTGIAPSWKDQTLATSGSLVFSPRHDSQSMTYGVKCSNATSDDTRWVNIFSKLPYQTKGANNCAIPYNTMIVDEWVNVWSVGWPGPTSGQKTIRLPQGKNLAARFNTGANSNGSGVITSAPTIGTAGLRTASLTQCPGDYTFGELSSPGMDPDCTETWGVASLLRYEVNDIYTPNNGVCELKSDADYYFNLRLTSACTNLNCYGLMDHTNTTP